MHALKWFICRLNWEADVLTVTSVVAEKVDIAFDTVPAWFQGGN